MTETTTGARRLLVLASSVVALALVATPLTAVATAAPAPQAQVAAATSPTVKSATATATTTAAQAAVTAADYSSIFATQVPSLVNAGWSSCGAPVTWSLDTNGLAATEIDEQLANLQWAFDQWSSATGLVFAYAGVDELAYDDSGFTLKPATGVASRHIYLAFIADADSARMGGSTVGLGSPSQVWPTTKEIVTGTAVFRTDHVEKASVAQARSLYLHELGHVFGLAHATEAANIMYSVVTDHVELGAGDTTGVRTMMKPCTEAA